MRIATHSCYVCNEAGNTIVASESPVEHRFGRPLMPEGVYDFARCKRCATLYVDSDVSQDYLDEIYKPESEEFVRDAGVARDALVSMRVVEFEKSWAQMKKWRSPRPGDQIVDLGCQTGEMGTVASRDRVVPNGIELSSAYAEHCRTVWGPESRVFCGSVSDASFRRGEIAYISAFEVLEHMCDPIAALQRMRGWLARDGIIAISVPSSDYFHFKFWMLRSSAISTLCRPVFEHYEPFYKTQVLPHTHIYNFSHKSLPLLLERSGFETLELGLTGWHGRLGGAFDRVGRILELASGRRIGMAPSLYAIARPTTSSPKPS